MHQKYLGDSYDLVKRFWAESLAPIARLFTHPKFIPKEIRSEYTTITRIPVLGEESNVTHFGVLMDPHTGTPLPTEASKIVSASHAPLSFIAQEFSRLNPAYVICFDQSHYRSHALDKVGQRDAKRAFLNQHAINSFYYVSHAPFLFVTKDAQVLKAIRLRLVTCGIPHRRFEPKDADNSADS